MDLVQLRYFITVVEFGSFTLAAKKCNVSQPALSQQIAKLEREFGCSLFDRQGRQVTLTRIGHTLRDRACAILRAVDDTRRQMTDDGRFGRINFSVAPVVGQFLAARLLQSLTKEFADSELVFSELPICDIIRSVENGEIDLGLIPYPVCGNRDLAIEPIFEEEIKIGVSNNHRLAKLSDIALTELNGEHIILLNQSHLFSQTILHALDRNHCSPKKTTLVDNFAMMNYLVSLEKGVGFFPNSGISKQSSSHIAFRSAFGLPILRQLAICWNNRRYQSQLVLNFIKAIREYACPELVPLENTDATPKPAKAVEPAPTNVAAR